MLTWPERIVALRKAADWSRSELARLMWVDPKTVYRWESGESLPSPRHELHLSELEERLAKDARDNDRNREAEARSS